MRDEEGEAGGRARPVELGPTGQAVASLCCSGPIAEPAADRVEEPACDGVPEARKRKHFDSFIALPDEVEIKYAARIVAERVEAAQNRGISNWTAESRRDIRRTVASHIIPGPRVTSARFRFFALHPSTFRRP